MRRVRFVVCVGYLLTLSVSVAEAQQHVVQRIGRLNPNFDAEREDSIAEYTALFFPAGVLRDGPFDATLGDVLIYTTEQFVNGQGNLGAEYTQAATNGHQIWNLDTGGEELVGGTGGGIEFDGHFYFVSDYDGLQKSDGIHSEPFLSLGDQPPFLGAGGVFTFQDRLLQIGPYQEGEFSPVQTRLFDATSGAATLLFDTFPNGQPFDLSNHRVEVVGDQILISINGVGDMYRVQQEASSWTIETVQFPATPQQASLFTPLAEKVLFTNFGADGFEPHVLEGLVATQLADINSGPDSANPFLLTPFGEKVVFSALGPSGREPYITDGTSVELLADLLPGAGDSDPRSFRVAGDRLYFSAIGPEGRQLYSSDGNSVTQISHFDNPPTNLSAYEPLQSIGNRVYFAYEDAGGTTLYAMEGQSLVEIPGLPDGLFGLSGLVEFGGMHYFTVGFGGGAQIFRTDGVAVEGVSAGLPGMPPNADGGLIALNGSLLFTGGDVDDWALYRLDVVPEPGCVFAFCSVIVLAPFSRVRLQC